MNICLIGAGRIGIVHAIAISSEKNTILHSVVDVNQPAAEDLAKKYSAQVLTIDEAFSNEDIDAYIIASSTATHADLIEKCSKVGKPVFCEKPLAISVSECLRVKNVVDKHRDRTVMLGFVRRYDRSYADAKFKLESGLVGKPFFIRSQTVDKDSFAPFQIEFCKSGGGIFHDFNVHDIDLVHWFSGVSINKVWSLGGAYRFKEFAEKDDADNTYAMCELDNGSMALIGASRVSPFGHNTFTEIQATHGNLKIGDPPKKNQVQSK